MKGNFADMHYNALIIGAPIQLYLMETHSNTSKLLVMCSLLNQLYLMAPLGLERKENIAHVFLLLREAESTFPRGAALDEHRRTVGKKRAYLRVHRWAKTTSEKSFELGVKDGAGVTH